MARVAHGRLSFARAGPSTAVRDAYAESPLKLLTPRNHGDAAWAYVSTLGGGLLGGDALMLDLRVEPGARAFVSTQGPTRVFGSQHASASTCTAHVEADAALVFAPDPAACFEGARFQQRTEVDLARGASLAFWDVLSGGRDDWGFQRCHSSLAVRTAGRPLIDDAWLLDAAHGPLRERMGRFSAVGTLLIAGPFFARIRASVLDEVTASRPERAATLLESASPLGDDALIVRLAAESVELLLRRLRARLAAVPALLGDDPWSRRS